mgnify:FL=1
MKTTKRALATLALAASVFATTQAYAMGCSGAYHDEVTMSCAAGSTWDADTRTCVPNPVG